MRGYRTRFICPCGGLIRMTKLEGHLVCERCNEDYGIETNKLRERVKQ